ncbi:hypothetical protein F8O07_10105 [Pseudoclavibacter sp. CFCC 13796]|uniref:hypothetical protein n=1 Tax=Pseudoclavibacter sp. CFCC 13796 TaxID=2615179 RepID=UPI0013018815|nr:hypothetical protein [Pseudoclavibacter sp. CFCC 13796]KAB1659923.1 hypothetical protein F8O07_10105 [Pseudoclavibacter sp. CFCC 13796]
MNEFVTRTTQSDRSGPSSDEHPPNAPDDGLRSVSVLSARRPWSAVVVAAFMMLLMLAPMLPALATPAHALGGGSTHAGRYEYGNVPVWMGSFRLDDGRIAWCAFDPGMPSPIDGDFSYTDWAPESSFSSGNGVDLSGEVLERAAYVLAMWGDTDDEFTARAVYRALHLHTGVGFSLRNGEQLTQDTAEHADHMWQEAGRFGGPHTLADPELTSQHAGQRVEAAMQTPRGRSGEAMPGDVVATITGPGVWDETGTAELRFAQDTTKTIRSTGRGDITVKVARAVPSTHLLIARPTVDGAQRLVASAENVAISAEATVAVVSQFQPAADTTAQTWRHDDASEDDLPQMGAPLVDTLHVRADGEVPWLPALDGSGSLPATFAVDWYYSPRPLPRSPKPPAEAEHFDRVQATATGPGDLIVSSKRVVDRSGWFYPVVSFRVADQPHQFRDRFAADFIADFHAEREQTVVPWRPRVVTQASEIVDGQVTDLISVSGNDPAAELTVVSELWMSHEPAHAEGFSEAPADAERLATVSTTITGNETVSTEPVDVPWSRFVGEDVWPNLYWVEHIDRSPSTERWQGRHLLPHETITLTRPTATTKTARNLVTGEQTTDTATVAGTIPTSNRSENVRTELSFSLYRFDDSTDGGAQPVCLAPMWTQPKPIAVTKPGDYVSEPVTIRDPGTYGFRHHLSTAVTRTSDAGTDTSGASDAHGPAQTTMLHEGECGADGETVVAVPPPVPPVDGEPAPPAEHIAPVSSTETALAATGVPAPVIWVAAGVSMIVLGTGAVLRRRRP